MTTILSRRSSTVDDGAVTAEAVYGRVALLTLSQPSVEAVVEHNRADIDFLAVMTGTDL